VAYGTLQTPAGMPMPQRLVLLYEQLKQLIALHRPETGAVEKLFFQRNVSTAMTVGQARGVALLAMAQAGLSVGEYNPNDVKQAVAVYGFHTTCLGIPLNADIGYRALYVDYSESGRFGKNGLDVLQHGPLMGVSFNW